MFFIVGNMVGNTEQTGKKSNSTLEEQINNLSDKILSTTIPTARPGDSGRPVRPLMMGSEPRRRPVDLPVPQPLPQRTTHEDDVRWQEIIQQSGLLKINGQVYRTQVKDLEHLGELGNGTCGHVVKMLHTPSKSVIAVKQMRRSGNSDENKRITMDIEVVLKSDDCPFIVQCVGCFILEADVWICMELMDTCFDKLLKRLHKPIPEHILGKVTVATVKALDYLKETHGVMHRDVKPSNILLDKRGNVKLCDFGISGRLVDSKAQTRSAGCAAYLAPERIDPPDPKHPDYDIRADVWSLGITLVELATGAFPYRDCQTDFEVLTKVLTTDPPVLPYDQNFSDEFRDFVNCCLTKDYKNRPKYPKLLLHPFITKYETTDVNVTEWYASESELSPRQSTTLQEHSEPRMVPQVSTAQTGTSSVTNNTSITSAATLNSPMRRFTGTTSSSARRSTPCHYPQHVRSVSETGRMFHPTAQFQNATSHLSSHPNHLSNGETASSGSFGRYTNSSPDAGSGGRFSPFHSSRVGAAVEPVGAEVGALRSTPPPMSSAHAFWQAQEARAAEWESNRLNVGSGFINSPVPGRKRFPSEPPQLSQRDSCYTGSTSPLFLQRYQHQQQQQQQHQHQYQYQQQNQQQHYQSINHQVPHNYNFHNHHPHNSYSQSQSNTLQMSNEPVESTKGEESSNSGKKRFTSILKFSLGGSNSPISTSSPSSPGRLPPPRPTRHAYPGPPPPSPDPPPRLSRMGLSDGSSSSPLAARRNFLDVSPVRRGVLDGSPSLPRRYVSPSPPQPPPRRLSTEGGPSSFNGTSGLIVSGTNSTSGTSSTPGSPQIRRFDSLRARYHYTPQPQRRVFGTTSDLHDL